MIVLTGSHEGLCKKPTERSIGGVLSRMNMRPVPSKVTSSTLQVCHCTHHNHHPEGQLQPPNLDFGIASAMVFGNRFGAALLEGTKARSGAVERGRSERTEVPQSRATNPNAISQCHSDGAKPSTHDANTPNGEKTTRPSAQNRPAALRNAITPAEPRPNESLWPNRRQRIDRRLRRARVTSNPASPSRPLAATATIASVTSCR